MPLRGRSLGPLGEELGAFGFTLGQLFFSSFPRAFGGPETAGGTRSRPQL